ncbi:VENN motif pre-toxin domain-containing protein [Dickeya fangzhongdai]|uniref:VENN motif pre-toxin domain-containing protein n=1 Tax=Dickeya fangzhongdai TaxID=1778540 RepID=UPI0026E10C59|nr:VENN motif pre-toxin domain-containing protein [Dickeya fangzhongdai]WKV50955.1 VENN motif pre-toxin domain-containing protein [Dickeya fangzhongdai]
MLDPVGRRVRVKGFDAQPFETVPQLAGVLGDTKNTSAGVNVSICVPPICAGQTVSGNASLSQQILNNRYASVTEQSGIKAGEDGFAIRVGGHTQLDGAVLASSAGAEKNRLETGTLGWRDIANVSSYQGRGISLTASTDSMPVGGLLQSTGKASGTTRSAVAPGTILLRDASQSQDIGQLSRDTSGTLGAVADGFKRSEVEDRLAIQKEMTSLGVQAMGAYGEYKKREAATAAAQRLTQEGVPASEMESRIKNSEEVRKAGESYAPGSAYWAAGTALTAALSGGLGGNLGGAVSGAAAPYLAKLVKDVSDGNEPVRVALHTVLGAFLARTQGGSATGGALGGFTAAAASGLIAQALYPKEKTLSAEQKQLVANLVMIAGAGVGGIAGGNLIEAGSAANTARNEVENNTLGVIAAETAANTAAAMAGAAGNNGKGDTGKGDDEEMGGSCEGTREQCAVRDGTRGPGHVLNSDGSENASNPNVGKDLTEAEKAELGGTGSGTPGGWGPEDEENARNNQQKDGSQSNNSDGASQASGKDKDTQIWTQTKKDDPVSNAYGHWEKHKAEFPEYQNSKQYVDAAHDFMRNPPEGTLTKTRPNGDTLYYNPKTNTFASKDVSGVPRTMFKPEKGMEYWSKQ